MNGQTLYSFLSKFYDLIFLKLLAYEKAANYHVAQMPFGPNDFINVLDTGLYTIAILNRFANAEVTAIDIYKQMTAQLKAKIE
jgi:hypothetical protein